MYDLDNRKDQLMTVLKLALANLTMWVRDKYFPPEYQHATWARLAPFFKLSGRVSMASGSVSVELRTFNDRALKRDLAAVCEGVRRVQPRLPDGRRLYFRMESPRDSRLQALARFAA